MLFRSTANHSIPLLFSSSSSFTFPLTFCFNYAFVIHFLRLLSSVLFSVRGHSLAIYSVPGLSFISLSTYSCFIFFLCIFFLRIFCPFSCSSSSFLCYSSSLLSSSFLACYLRVYLPPPVVPCAFLYVCLVLGYLPHLKDSVSFLANCPRVVVVLSLRFSFLCMQCFCVCLSLFVFR